MDSWVVVPEAGCAPPTPHPRSCCCRCAPWWPPGPAAAGWATLSPQVPPRALPGEGTTISYSGDRKRDHAVFCQRPLSRSWPSPGQDWWMLGGQHAGLCSKPLHPPALPELKTLPPCPLSPSTPCPRLGVFPGIYPQRREPIPLPCGKPTWARAAHPTKPEC